MANTETAIDVAELRRQYPAPVPIELSTEHREQLARQIHAGIRRRDRRASVARRAVAPTLLAACCLTLAVLITNLVSGLAGDTRSPMVEQREVVVSAGTAQVLEAAAVTALEGPAMTVRDDQFVYTRSAVISNEGRLGGEVTLGELHTRETWFAQDPDSYGWEGNLIREFGQDWPIDYSGPAPAGVDRPTYRWLTSLPDEPSALLDVLYDQAQFIERQEPEQAVFDLIGNLINEQALPPRTAAAFYRAATLIPGVEMDRRATDALGRPGTGISRTDSVFGTRNTWVFDSTTHKLLGMRYHFTSDSGPDVLNGATAILEIDVVDRTGVAPESAA